MVAWDCQNTRTMNEHLEVYKVLNNNPELCMLFNMRTNTFESKLKFTVDLLKMKVNLINLMA